MNRIIAIDKNWEFTWIDYQGNVDRILDYYPNRWRDAQVPGVAQLDLMDSGDLPDLFVGMNVDHALWMERKDWCQRTRSEIGCTYFFNTFRQTTTSGPASS